MFSATCRLYAVRNVFDINSYVRKCLCLSYGIRWINRKTQMCEETGNFLHLIMCFDSVCLNSALRH
jgi:hypothetical protein